MAASLGRILAVDNEPDILAVIAAYFEDSGYEVVTALDGPQGLTLAERHRPDVVLLDIRMPGPSGVEVMQQMRARWPGLPIIMLTGLYDVRLARLTLQRGAFDYIAKPFDFDHLHRCVAAALAWKNARAS